MKKISSKYIFYFCFYVLFEIFLFTEIFRYQETIKMMEQTHVNQIKELKREINSMENKLSMEKAATDAEKRKNNAIIEQQQSVEEEFRLSPTLSIERDSMSSVNSIWPVVNLFFKKDNEKFFIAEKYQYYHIYFSLMIQCLTVVLEDFQMFMKVFEQARVVRQFLKIYKHS